MADKGRLLASADFSQQELRWLAIYTQEPALIEVYQKGLDMHSRITCQVQGFHYDMFEQIRNYRRDTAHETEQNIKSIIEKWGGTKELQFALKKFNIQGEDEASIKSLAGSFDLIRGRMKSVTFGKIPC